MRAPADHVSDTPTDYAVDCPGDAWGEEHACGRTWLTKKGWDHQMQPKFAHSRWKCPICGGNSWPWCRDEEGDEEDAYE